MNTEMRNKDSKDFEDRLHKIRALGAERRSREQAVRSDATRTRSQRIMNALRAVDRIEGLVAELGADLSAELGRHVERSRGLFDGRYQLVLRLEECMRDGGGEGQDYHSRLQLLIKPCAETGRLTVECRSTVRNRDLDSAAHEADVCAGSLAAIRTFLEHQVLAFAEAWCAGDEAGRTEDLLDLSWAEAAVAA